ncbi:MAG: glycosyltransferase family 9 protein [Acidobacteriota bacterium]|nr:MAG: glycosyltransferase family 9 protein [Acidobacteriota bacterium]
MARAVVDVMRYHLGFIFGISMSRFHRASHFTRSNSTRFLYWAAVLNQVDVLARAFPKTTPSDGRKRVLFVRFDGIGDYVIWTSSFDLIRSLYPAAAYERILVANRSMKDLVDPEMFEQAVFVDQQKFVTNPRYRFSVMRQVSGFGADVAVNPRLSREFLWNDSVIRVSGAARRIGTHGISNRMTPVQKRISDRWYDILTPEPVPGEHECISNDKFLAFASEKPEPGVHRPPNIGIPAHFGHGLEPKSFAVIFPGAHLADKRWPSEKFASVIDHLNDVYGLRCVIAGGSDDTDRAAAIGALCRSKPLDLTGKTGLLELTRLIGDARIVITNDTSAAHIAVAEDIPVVVITPGNHVGRFFPYPDEMDGRTIMQFSALHEMECFGCCWNCIYSERPADEPTPCVKDVPVGTVIAGIQSLL